MSTTFQAYTIFENGNYVESVIFENNSIRIVHCSELGIDRLYRIQYGKNFSRHKVSYTEEGAMKIFADFAPLNIPLTKVQAVVYRNAFEGGLEVYRDMEVTLDKNGIHGICMLGEEEVMLTRLNASLDYSFDAPSIVCPINAKANYTFPYSSQN